MTILQALNTFYERLDARGRQRGVEEVPQRGYEPVRIHYVLEINREGRPVELRGKISLRENSPRMTPKLMMPAMAFNREPKKNDPVWESLAFTPRTSGIRAFLFWEKTDYAFGLDSDGKPKVKQHAAFKEAHRTALATTTDEELRALLAFIETWQPSDWQRSGLFPPEALGANFAFQLVGQKNSINQTGAAEKVILDLTQANPEKAECLVTGGEPVPFVAKQPQFKGVAGAQSSGAPIVSFNADAFESYGKSQGANAPVSEEAAFRYGAALNWLLDRDNGRSLRLGETTVVFWADAKDIDEDLAKAAEDNLGQVLDPPDGIPNLYTGDDDEEDEEYADRDHDAAHSARIGAELGGIRDLRRAPDGSDIPLDTRIHILGLSPNAGRIAVRFWLVDAFGAMADNLEQFMSDMSLQPNPFRGRRLPKFRAFLLELVPFAIRFQRKKVDKLFASKWAAQVAGEFFVSVLTGRPLPVTILASVISRIRSDGFIARKFDDGIEGARVALVVAAVNRKCRSREERIPMALDIEHSNPAYRLGRLFALIEGVQRAALPKLNATVKDKFFGAACATPARVFPLLHKNAMNHLSKVRKERGEGLAHWMDQQIGQVWAGLSPDLPRYLTLEDQARFIAGYYHQRFTEKPGVPKEVVEVLRDDDASQIDIAI